MAQMTPSMLQHVSGSKTCICAPLRQPCRVSSVCKASSSSNSRIRCQEEQQIQQQDTCTQSIQQQNSQLQTVGSVQRASCLPFAAVAAGTVALLAAAAAAHPEAASAFEIHTEPSNALSLPTWAIHVSSVTEWVAAMALFWKYAEVTGNQRWKGMTWGMMPSLGSAMAACTWHFFYNSPGARMQVLGGGRQGPSRRASTGVISRVAGQCCSSVLVIFST